MTFQPFPRVDAGIRVDQVLAGPHKNFHYVFGDDGVGAWVDPAFELTRLAALTDDRGLVPRIALFTHGHWDHIGGIPDIASHGIETVVLHEAAADHPKVGDAHEADMDVILVGDGQSVPVGGLDVEVLHTPGHQPEGTCFRAADALFGGDTLFIGSCGRTDFPGGDTDAMFESMARLRELPDELVVLPGHHYAEAPWRSLGDEKQGNPALATHDRADFRQLHCLTH